MVWHDNCDTRKAYGDLAENVFADTCRCSCGGRFDFIGDKQKGFPDYTCDNCGKLVDVKYSPQAEDTGNIAVSSIPWDHYPDDLLLVTFIKGKFIGAYKKDIQTINRTPRNPTHFTKGVFGNTQFYLIPWAKFSDLEELGFSV